MMGWLPHVSPRRTCRQTSGVRLRPTYLPLPDPSSGGRRGRCPVGGTDLLTRLSPFTLPTATATGADPDEARPDQQRPGLATSPVAAWADSIFELVETGLTTQRHHVDQGSVTSTASPT